MTKNVIIMFLLSIALWNCSPQKEKNLAEFESILGSDNTKVINELLNDFENDYLKREYPNLSTEKAYETYLIEIAENKKEKWKTISKGNREKFENSQLFLDLHQVVDSFWIETDSSKMKFPTTNTVLVTKFNYLDENGILQFRIHERPIHSYNKPIDSILKHQSILVLYNPLGKYHKALSSLKNRSDLITYLFDNKDAFGFIPTMLLASDFLKIKIDFNNELNRRLIMLEMEY